MKIIDAIQNTEANFLQPVKVERPTANVIQTQPIEPIVFMNKDARGDEIFLSTERTNFSHEELINSLFIGESDDGCSTWMIPMKDRCVHVRLLSISFL